MKKLTAILLAFVMVLAAVLPLATIGVSAETVRIDDQGFTLIKTWEELKAINGKPGYYALANDLDLGGALFTEAQIELVGVLDGQGHTIKNFNLQATSNAGVSLFRQGQGSAVVRNLNVGDNAAKVKITTGDGDDYGTVAVLFGTVFTSDLSIYNVNVYANVEPRNAMAGGFIGRVRTGAANVNISESTMNGAVLAFNANKFSGAGFIAHIDGGVKSVTIENCINYAAVQGREHTSGVEYNNIGGFIGLIQNGTDCEVVLKNCLNSNTYAIEGQNCVGGAIGYINGAKSVLIDGFVNHGPVNIKSWQGGGAVGRITSASTKVTVTNVINVAGISRSGGQEDLISGIVGRANAVGAGSAVINAIQSGAWTRRPIDGTTDSQPLAKENAYYRENTSQDSYAGAAVKIDANRILAIVNGTDTAAGDFMAGFRGVYGNFELNANKDNVKLISTAKPAPTLPQPTIAELVVPGAGEAEGVVKVRGVQHGSDGSSLRLIAEIVGNEYQAAGFYVTINNQTLDCPVHCCYTSLAVTGQNGIQTNILPTAEGNYLIAYEITNISAANMEDMAVTFKPYVNNGTAVYGTEYTYYAKTHTFVSTEQKLSVMSFNVYGGEPIDDTRIDRIAGMIKLAQPDVVGIQEGVDGDKAGNMLTKLTAALSETYERSGNEEGRTANPELCIHNNFVSDEYNVIYYNKNKFTLVEEGTKWLSDTPDVCSKYLSSNGSATGVIGEYDGSYWTRAVNYLVLRRNSDQKVILFANTHLDENGQFDRGKQATALIGIINAVAERYGNCPAFVTGDFNQQSNENGYRNMESGGYRDSGAVAKVKVNEEKTVFSPIYAEWNPDAANKDIVATIDYCFSKNVDAGNILYYRVMTNTINGNYPSDHYPAYFEFRL